MITFAGYEEKYHDGVLSCIMRNFDAMQGVSRDVVDRWMEPMLAYRFSSEQPRELPYQHGIVMLADGDVVGYTGCIYSFVETDVTRYTVCKVTTTAIDEKYRLGFFKMKQEILDSADAVITFTPVESLRRIYAERFRFRYFDERNLKFYPIPSCDRHVRCLFVGAAGEIGDERSRALYRDHLPYDVRCLSYTGEGKTGYLFYKVAEKKRGLPVFGERRLRFAEVLEVTDHAIFSRHAPAIIWAVERRERAILTADSRFFGGQLPASLRYREYPTWRMFYAGDPDFPAERINAMYSELSMLGEYR